MASLMDDSVNSAEKQGTQDPSPPVDPAAHSLAPPGVSQPLAPYPYAPYGYTPQNQPAQPAYPHAPYYPPHPHLPPLPHAYPPPYPYPGYPPHPHASVYSPRGSSAAPMPGPSAPSPGPPPPPPANDDLPSYEEMIVEALLEMGDPEGAAPKDLFAWMASRYPLQTNFRPSASQALQKAFKRGRLEKRAGGRYRLNAAWEGGAVSSPTYHDSPRCLDYRHREAHAIRYCRHRSGLRADHRRSHRLRMPCITHPHLPLLRSPMPR